MQHLRAGQSVNWIGPSYDRSDADVSVVDKAKTVTKTLSDKQIRVLLVEDDPIVMRVTTMLLQTMRCDVVHAANGEVALKLISEQEFDLVLMDVGLPDRSGDEVTRTIRDWEREGKLVKQHIVFGLTAHVDQDSRDRCIEAGMDDVLSKPLKKQMFEKMLAQLVEEK